LQTFMPFPSVAQSLHVLDDKRLGKQRVEALQIVKAIDDPTYGWQHHPAVNMWRGHREALIRYGQVACIMWIMRGFGDGVLPQLEALSSVDGDVTMPPWFGDQSFHESHQSNLVRKDQQHYGPLFPGVSDDLPYVWPVR